jgi:hypothetical protein
LAGVETEGLSFEEFLFLAECNGAHVRAFRASPEGVSPSHPSGNPVSLSRFRSAIHSATHRTDLHLVASFSRKILGQTGSGHYSPIGAYHAESDMALVLDVARFKYPPYWAPVSLLWKAVCAIDEATGRGRGYYLMSKGKLSGPSVHTHALDGPEPAPAHTAAAADAREATIFTPLSVACRIAVDKQSWSRLAEHFCSVLPSKLAELERQGAFRLSSRAADPRVAPAPSVTSECGEVLRAVLHSLPVELGSIFIMYTHDLSQRMVEQYTRSKKNNKQRAPTVKQPGADACPSPDTAASSAICCDASHSCAVHPADTSSLPLYPTFLPAHTPHVHSHAIPSVHALHPLLHAIAQSPLFHVLQAANIDVHAVQYTRPQQQQQQSPPPPSSLAAPSSSESVAGPLLASVASLEPSAAGGVGFHLLASSAEGELELATLLLFACPGQVFSLLRPELQAQLTSLRRVDALPPSLQTEVHNLRAQMGILADFCACGAAPSIIGNDSPNVDPKDVHDNQSHNLRAQAEAEAPYTPHNGHTACRHTNGPASANNPTLHRFVGGVRARTRKQS